MPKRVEAVLRRSTLCAANDPNEVILLFEAVHIIRAKVFADSAPTRKAMQRVGVLDKNRASISSTAEDYFFT
jgi:hypothetical protein